MKGIALVTILSLFSVAIPIQSLETVYTYNYDNFGDFFPQGDREDFNIHKYADNDTIFDAEYKGTNIGGAFLVLGNSSTTMHFEGQLLDITATFYCGSTFTDTEVESLWIYVYYVEGGIAGTHVDRVHDAIYICEERGWHYNYTTNPQLAAKYQVFNGFNVTVGALNATANRAYGFDELRITTSDTPPQLLQRDNNN